MSKIWSTLGALPVILIMGHFWVGLLYWWWIAYDLGSWWMWGLSLFPPFTVVAVLTSIWSMYLGIPAWVFAHFGA